MDDLEGQVHHKLAEHLRLRYCLEGQSDEEVLSQFSFEVTDVDWGIPDSEDVIVEQVTELVPVRSSTGKFKVMLDGVEIEVDDLGEFMKNFYNKVEDDK